MNILIVGGAGEVGKYLVKDFAQQGHMVRILDMAPMSPEIGANPGISYFQGNLIDKALVQNAVSGSDVVINLAWSFADDPHTIFGTDIIGTANLLDAAATSEVQSLIYSSTAVVYGRALYNPVTEEHPCLIEHARKPFYALGKYAAEKLCLLYFKERGLPITIFRFWWSYGREIKGKYLRELIRLALSGQTLSVPENAGGSFLHLDDFTEAILLAVKNAKTFGEIFNLSTLYLSWEDVAKMIIEITGSSSPLQVIPRQDWKGAAFLGDSWELSTAKAKEVFHCHPLHSLEMARQGLRDAISVCYHNMTRPV